MTGNTNSIPKIIFDQNELEKWFCKVEKLLLDQSKIRIINYENKDCISNFTKLNKHFLDDIKNKPVVYCIWIGDSLTNLNQRYIGHAKETISRARMIAHFSNKNKRTGSQLEKIKTALEKDLIIGATFVQIDPPYMRMSIEEWLIGKYSDKLEWNRNGKIKSLQINDIDSLSLIIEKAEESGFTEDTKEEILKQSKDFRNE